MQKYKNYLPLLGLTAFILVFYGRTMSYDFTNWDDPWLLLQNPVLSSPSADHLKTIFFNLSQQTRKHLGAEYLPLRDLLVSIERMVFGSDPVGYHAVSIGMFVLICVLLYILIGKAGIDSKIAAALATVAFAVHPARSENVAWLSDQKDLLCTLFLLGSAILLFKRILLANQDSKKTNLILFPSAVLMFMAAVLSKYTAVVFPIIAVAAVWIFVKEKRSVVLTGAAFFLPALLLFFIAWFVGSSVSMTRPLIGGSLAVNWLTSVWLFVKYIFYQLFPVKTYVLWNVEPVKTFTDSRFVAAAIFLLMLITFAAVIKRVHPAVVLGTIWFLVAVLPVSQLIPLPNKFAARYLILPSVGFALVSAAVLSKINKKAIFVFAFVYIAILALLCNQALPRWKNCATLWKDLPAQSRKLKSVAAENLLWCMSSSKQAKLEEIENLAAKFKDSPRVLNAAGYLFSVHGMPERAEECFIAAHKVGGDKYAFFNNIGLLYLKAGKLNKAESLFKNALKFCKGSKCAPVWANLGYIAMAKGKPFTAIFRLRRSLYAGTFSPRTLSSLTYIYKKLGLESELRDLCGMYFNFSVFTPELKDFKKICSSWN